MQEDFDTRLFLVNEATDIVEQASKLDVGSDEFSNACSQAKWMFDAANRQNEIELKEKQMEQEMKIHKDSHKSDMIRHAIEVTKVRASAVLVAIGYKFNFKAYGTEFGKTFIDMKQGFTRFLHKF